MNALAQSAPLSRFKQFFYITTEIMFYLNPRPHNFDYGTEIKASKEIYT